MRGFSENSSGMSTALICWLTRVDGVVLEGDDPHRAGAHAGAAAAAARFVEDRVALFVLVDGAEGTFHRAALALGTAFLAEARVAQIPDARVDGGAVGGALGGLDRLHGPRRPARPGLATKIAANASADARES